MNATGTIGLLMHPRSCREAELSKHILKLADQVGELREENKRMTEQLHRQQRPENGTQEA